MYLKIQQETTGASNSLLCNKEAVERDYEQGRTREMADRTLERPGNKSALRFHCKYLFWIQNICVIRRADEHVVELLMFLFFPP
jgi:hypothetical protein